jgi:hypothetical protein
VGGERIVAKDPGVGHRERQDVWDAKTGSEIIRIAHDDFVRDAVFNHDGTRIATAAGETVYVCDAVSGTEICHFAHDDRVDTVAFSPDGGQIVTACRDRMVRIWDATWLAGFTGDRLVRAVARAGLAGDGRLTADEQRLLHPVLGDVDPDVISRWLQPSPDDAGIEDALARWRRHRAMSLALLRADQLAARASRGRMAPACNP